MIPAIERGYPQLEIANSSFELQKSVGRGESVIVGVNKFTEQEDQPIELLQIDESSEVVRTLNALRCAAPRKARITPCRSF